MFVAVQIPLADLRPFVGTDTGRVPRPGWPNPQVDADFVRTCGPVRERPRGGIEPWSGEGAFANATRALRFVAQRDRWARVGMPPSVPLRCIYRRLYSDGTAIMRAEVGFGVPLGRRPPDRILAAEARAAVDDCLAIPVRVPIGAGEFKSPSLAMAGPALARCLLRATLLKGVTPERWWMSAVRPTAVVAMGSEDLEKLAQSADRVSVGSDGPTVLHQVFELEGRTVPVWFLPREYPFDPELLRRIRLHLFRLHAEREVLKCVLSAAAAGRLADAAQPEPFAALEWYLSKTLPLIEKGKIYNVGPTDDLRSALRLGELVNPGERDSLLAQLRDVRTTIRRKLELAAVNERLQPSITVNEGGVVKVSGEDKSVNINAGGDFNAVGSNFGAGNTLIAESITQAQKSAASAELKDTLTELGEVVKAMGEELAQRDPGQADGAARDVKAMVDEATSESPRKSVIERIGDGLLATAKTVGEVGVPVIAAVTKLIALFA